MKKIAFAALMVGVASTGLLACGGDDDGGDITFADSAPVEGCNPVTQEGCADGEKCSWLVVSEDPFLGRTDCVPDGTVEVGGTCADGAAGEETGFDDCAAGGLCIAMTCRAICTIDPDSCGEGFACSSYVDTFSDDPAENIGVCDPTCNPVAQDCEDETQGCYLQLFNGKATCARVATGAETQTQGQQCVNDGASCFLNGCAAGYGAFLYAGDGVPRDCSAFCAPVDTYLNDPDGDGTGMLADGSDPQGDAAIADCTGERVGNMNGMQCRHFQSFFVDMNSNYLDYIADSYGFCTPKTADTFGDCTKFSEEWFFASYNTHIDGGGTPENWGMKLTQLCDMRAGGCASGCAKLETLDMLITTFCEKPANVDSPACAEGLRGAKVVRRSLEKLWAEQWLQAGIAVPKK